MKYEVNLVKFVNDFYGREVADWEIMTPQQVFDEFDGGDEVALFVEQSGLKGTQIPKIKYREFADWLCANYPEDVRKV